MDLALVQTPNSTRSLILSTANGDHGFFRYNVNTFTANGYRLMNNLAQQAVPISLPFSNIKRVIATLGVLATAPVLLLFSEFASPNLNNSTHCILHPNCDFTPAVVLGSSVNLVPTAAGFRPPQTVEFSVQENQTYLTWYQAYSDTLAGDPSIQWNNCLNAGASLSCVTLTVTGY